jgi:hypothetical protein
MKQPTEFKGKLIEILSRAKIAHDESKWGAYADLIAQAAIHIDASRSVRQIRSGPGVQKYLLTPDRVRFDWLIGEPFKADNVAAIEDLLPIDMKFMADSLHNALLERIYKKRSSRR